MKKALPLLLAGALAASAIAFAADPMKPLVDPKEPPKTPAGGAVEPPVAAATAAAVAVVIAVGVALGSDDDDARPVTATATATN